MIKQPIPETTVYKKVGEVGVIEYQSLNSLPWLVNAFSHRATGGKRGGMCAFLMIKG